MPATFDGVNLVVTLPAATSIVDSETDIYSEWKKWAVLDDNLGVEQAFRTIGGDPLTPGIDAGAYFFIRNDLGWRIRPAEEDATVLLTGNLAPEDSSLPILIPTIGTFRVLVQGLQPITQSVDALLTLQQDSSFQGCVHVDTFGITTGTGYPKGTASEPVNNLADAVAIANRIGVRCLKLIGVVELDRAFQFWSVQGLGAVAEIDVNGQDISGTRFEACGVHGICGAFIQRAVIDLGRVSPAGLSNYVGVLSRSVIDGDISLVAGETSIINCSSNIAGPTTPILDAQGALVDLSVRQWTGGLELRNFSLPGCVASFDLLSANLVLASTVSDGAVLVRGIGLLEENNGPGVDLDHDGLIHPDELSKLNYEGRVFVDSINGVPGTAHPAGTRSHPVDTIADAVIIASTNNLNALRLVDDTVVQATDDISGLEVEGIHPLKVQINILAGALTDKCQFRNLYLRNCVLQGWVAIREGLVENVTGFRGVMHQTMLNPGVIGLAAGAGGAHFLSCYSGQPGPGGTPVIDIDGKNLDLGIRDYSGGIALRNNTAANDISVDMASGQVILEPTVVSGDIVCRGIGKLIDNSIGATVLDELLDPVDIRLMKQIAAGKAVISIDDLTATIYDEDEVTVLLVLNRTADGRIRTPA